MPLPRLSFACELDDARLSELFADGVVIADLQALEAEVALMLSDLSDVRASRGDPRDRPSAAAAE
jgi:hypothetical protein